MDNKEGLISVIIPVYKVEDYLDCCLESVVNQTYQDLEIILVDDGSPDRSPEMCDGWAKKDSRIKVIHKQNGGLSDARNVGIAAARGQYISFIDSDDWIADEMLERLVISIKEQSSDIACCAVQIVDENGAPLRLLTQPVNCVLDTESAEKALMDESLLKQPVWYRLYKHTIIRSIPFAVGRQHEDVFWSYQAIGAANRVSIIDYIGYFYRQRKGSIMETYTIKRLDVIEAVEKRYRYIADHFPALGNKARCSILGYCIYQGQMSLKHLPHEEQKEAFIYLETIKKRYPLKHSYYAQYKLTHRIWFDLARVSLKAACKVKNWLAVGM